jgi:alpha-glucosidase
MVIQKSPLGLRCNDESFAGALTFDHDGKKEGRREKYDLFAGTKPHVNHLVNHRTLAFHNPNHVPVDIELEAGDEGVAFRYCFTQSSSDVSATVLPVWASRTMVCFERGT